MSHEYPYSIKRHGTNLEKCEDEPVQTPGCIQAHGVLLVLRLGDLTVLQVSENCRDWLGLSPLDLLGKNVAAAVGGSITEKIRSALNQERLDKVPLYLATFQLEESPKARSLHVSLHTHSGLALLELEDATASASEQTDQIHVDPDYYGLVRKALTRFQEACSVKTLAQEITEQVRRTTGLDRVMVYYFHADDSGEVIAESKRKDQTPWLGFRYPAHDIPRPAREIFKKIWSRPVPDVRAELFEMVPLLNPDTQKPLDMTYCSLRGASIMYTEYLDNMGIRAALTLPLMREGELWGLIACHHDAPKLMSYRIRAAAEFLARGASQQLMLADEKENMKYRVSLEAANYALISKVALAPELSAFTEGPVHLGSGLDCGGAAIFCQESWNKVGQTPQVQEMSELGQWLLTQPTGREGSSNCIFVTDQLSEQYPAAKDFSDIASGLMAFCFSRNPLGLVFYFKPETLQTLTWAGNPHELPVLEGVHGSRLSPRKSFEVWRETVRNRSMPWKKVEIEAVVNLRGLIVDMLVSKAEQLNTLRLRVAERTHELEQSREHLKLFAQRLSLATQALEAGVWEWDIYTNLIIWDEKMYKIYGIPSKAPMSYHLWTDTVIPEDLPQVEAALQGVIASKSQGSAEFRITLPNGSIRYIQAAEGAILDDAGQVVQVVGVNIDVTERKKIERQFLRAQRMESIGTLGSGMAHDLNNSLAPIVMSIELLKGMSESPEARSILEAIEASAKRGTDIVAQVLSFARGMESEKMEVQTKDLMRDLENTIKNTFPKDVRSRFSIPENIWTIWGDSTQIHQVLLNLCLNSRDAMPHGGSLSVIGENCLLDGQQGVMNLQAKAGRYVVISVTDTGIGIPPSILDKVFEPFFTTKTLQKGTGLGLSTSLAIVKSHAGIINVYSELGKGTSFRLCLPATESPLELLKAPTEEGSLPRGDGVTVLLVDDEDSIRTITGQMLETYGYQVLVATDGADAVGTYAQHQLEIAVVLTDMNMPVMDGPATVHALIRINPKVKIIAASGLNANENVAKAAGAGVKHFLTKPYTAATLLKALRAITNEAG
jgi:PAS domain S-box-containing protein